MKQYINKEQWDELSEKQKKQYNEKYPDCICLALNTNTNTYKKMPKCDIGQMIEFLGDDWYYDLFDIEDGECGCTLIKKYKGELCDWLWEAVKYKLKQQYTQ